LRHRIAAVGVLWAPRRLCERYVTA